METLQNVPRRDIQRGVWRLEIFFQVWKGPPALAQVWRVGRFADGVADFACSGNLGRQSQSFVGLKAGV